jgi:hypothetical protein
VGARRRKTLLSEVEDGARRQAAWRSGPVSTSDADPSPLVPATTDLRTETAAARPAIEPVAAQSTSTRPTAPAVRTPMAAWAAEEIVCSAAFFQKVGVETKAPSFRRGPVAGTLLAHDEGCRPPPIRYGWAMDDGWAVVFGAAIALIASVVGGVMSTVIGPFLSRRADANERRRVASEERRGVLQTTISDASLSLRAYALARRTGDPKESRQTREEVVGHMIRLRLWTTQAEKEVADRLMHALSLEDAEQAYAAAWAWERLAARWFRRALADEDFADTYEQVRADRYRAEVASKAARAHAASTGPAGP